MSWISTPRGCVLKHLMLSLRRREEGRRRRHDPSSSMTREPPLQQHCFEVFWKHWATRETIERWRCVYSGETTDGRFPRLLTVLACSVWKVLLFLLYSIDWTSLFCDRGALSNCRKNTEWLSLICNLQVDSKFLHDAISSRAVKYNCIFVPVMFVVLAHWHANNIPCLKYPIAFWDLGQTTLRKRFFKTVDLAFAQRRWDQRERLLHHGHFAQEFGHQIRLKSCQTSLPWFFFIINWERRGFDAGSLEACAFDISMSIDHVLWKFQERGGAKWLEYKFVLRYHDATNWRRQLSGIRGVLEPFQLGLVDQS